MARGSNVEDVLIHFMMAWTLAQAAARHGLRLVFAVRPGSTWELRPRGRPWTVVPMRRRSVMQRECSQRFADRGTNA